LHALTGVPRFAVRLTVAVLVAASVGLGAPRPAQAATCSSASGVSVVVDFHQLGGGVQTFCDAGGAGKYADAQLVDAGYSLTYVQRQPGFVCRVNGTPASDPCVNTPPADAYWSLWWSDGKSGRWTYASTGVASLKVPAGGYVGLSWQQGTAKATPGVAAKAHSSSSPTSHSTSQPPSAPTSAPPNTTGPGPSTAPHSTATSSGSLSSSGSPSGGPAAGGTGKHTHATKATAGPHPRSKSADASPPTTKGTDGPVPTEAGGPLDPSAGSPGGGGLPGWVAPAAVVLLFAAAGTVLVVRRRGSGGA
jgi:hypothetical protein